MEFNEGLNIVLLLVIVLQSVLISKQVDMKKVNELIMLLEGPVKKSETKIDDAGLDVIKMIRDLINGQSVYDPPADDGGELSA